MQRSLAKVLGFGTDFAPCLLAVIDLIEPNGGKDVLLRFAREGWLPAQEGVHDDTCRPDIDLFVLRLSFDYLWRQIVRTAPRYLAKVGLVGEPEIRNFDVELLRIIEQYVLGFDVPVYNVPIMHVVQSIEKLFGNVDHVQLCDRLLLALDVLEELPVLYQLRDNVVSLIIMQELIDMHYVGMLHLLHDTELPDHLLSGHITHLNLLLLDSLDSHRHIRQSMPGLQHRPESPLANQLPQLIPISDLLDLP